MRETPSSGFLTRSDINKAVKSQKQARGSKFWIKEDEGLYYMCSKKKGADQLCSSCITVTAQLIYVFIFAKENI